MRNIINFKNIIEEMSDTILAGKYFSYFYWSGCRLIGRRVEKLELNSLSNVVCLAENKMLKQFWIRCLNQSISVH